MKLIREFEDFDWIREIPSNPLQWHKPKINLDNVERDEEGYPLQQGFGEGEIWVDVDGLTQDQKINVLKNIESIIGELRFENTLTTIKSIEGNKNRDYCLGDNIKGYLLHCGHEEYDFFSQENHVCCMSMGYQTFREEVQIEVPRINGRDLIRMVYMNINEDADWDWVRSIKPKMPFNQIQLGKKYQFTYGKTFEDLVYACGINEDVFDATTVKGIKFDKFCYNEIFCDHERDDVVETLLLGFFGVNGNLIRSVWVTEDALDLHPL